MIRINLKDKNIHGDQPKATIMKDEYKILIYGKLPILFGNQRFNKDIVIQYFSNDLNSIMPYMCGVGLCILLKNEKVTEIAVDYYAHSRYYYTKNNSSLFICENWKELPIKSSEFNIFQLLYFLNWNSCLDGETYFKEIKYFSPTYKYCVDNDSIEKSYMSFMDMGTSNLYTSIQDTMKILDSDENIGIMLSGGSDSCQIAMAAKNMNKTPVFLCGQIKDIEMYDNICDQVGAACLSKEMNLDFELVPIQIKEFLQGWKKGGKDYLTDSVAFSYKDGRLWQGIASYASNKGIDLIINGQNADALYNYSYTSDSEMDKMMRTITTDSILEKIFSGSVSDSIKNIWYKYNDCDFSIQRFLGWVIIKGNGYKKYNGIIVDNAVKNNIKDFYDEELIKRMDNLISLYLHNKIKTPRGVLLEGKLVGYVDGEDTRCISGACEVYGINSLQIYSSPLVFDALLKLELNNKDINDYKRITYETCDKNPAFLKTKEIKSKVDNSKTYSASKVWEIVYNILNEEFDFDGNTIRILSVFDELNIFDINKLKDIMKNDIGVMMRVSWIGLIYNIINENLK